ncbi:MAG: hypothetical protein MUC69_09855, partial [Gemmatimonadales bacterium]|nr:hypothetical protein [Gemmatimonadales bacterium]
MRGGPYIGSDLTRHTLVLPFCALAWLGLVAAPPNDAATLRDVEREADRAVQAGTHLTLRRRWERALAGDPANLPAMLGLATIARLTYDFPTAHQLYERLLTPSDSLRPGMLYGELGRAQLYVARWEPDSGLAAAERARRWARTQGDRAAEARAGIIAARFVARSLGLDSAAALVAHALATAPRSDASLVAVATCWQASALRNTDPKRALQLAERGERLARSAGDRRTAARCLHTAGSAHEAAGHPSRARVAFAAAAALAGEAHDDDGRSAALQWLAYSTIQQSDSFPAGRRYAEEAIALARRTGNRQVLAWAELNLAQLAIKLGDPATAGRLAGESLERMRGLGDRFGEGQARLVAGDAAFLAGRLVDAEVAYTTCDSLLQMLRLAAQRPSLLIRLAGVRRERGDLSRAEATLAEATAQATAVGADGVVNDAHYERGLQELARRRWLPAVAEFRAFQAAEGDGIGQRVVDAELRIAEALAGAGDFAGADLAVAAAIGALDRVRTSLETREAQVQLLQARRWDFDPDLGVATLADRYVRAGRVAEAFRIVEMQRARRLQQALTSRQALADGRIGGADAAATGVVDAAEVRRRLPAGTALLEFVSGRGGEPTTAFVLTAEGVAAYRVAPADSLVEPIERFATLLEGGSSADALARALGRRIVMPAVDHLRS